MSNFITIQPDTEKLRKRQFENSNYTQIRFPKKPKFTKIPSSFTENNRKLLSVDIPKNVKKIKEAAFKSCVLLALAEIPANLKKLGKSVFENCRSLSLVDLSACRYLTKIKAKTFANCTKLREIQLPENIQKIARQWKNLLFLPMSAKLEMRRL